MASSTRAFFAGIGTTFVILGVGFGGGLMVAKTALTDSPAPNRVAAHQIEPARVVLPTTAEAAPAPQLAAVTPEPAPAPQVSVPEQQVEKVDLKMPEAADTKKAEAEERARKKRYAERKARQIAAARQRLDAKRQMEAKQQEATQIETARAPQPAVMAYGWDNEPRQVSFFGN